MYHTKIGGTMEDFFDKLQDKILIIDYSGKILFCNKTLLNQLQYQLDDLDNIYNLIINSNIKFNTIDINCNKEYIVDILTKNNSTIPFKLNLSFILLISCICFIDFIPDSINKSNWSNLSLFSQ